MQALRTRRFAVTASLATVALVWAVAQAPPAVAASITVTTTDDELNSDGDCSLREAIEAANLDSAVDACTAGSGADTITVPAGTYTIAIPEPTEAGNSQGDFDLHSNITISGAGSATTIVDGGGLDRVFEQHPGNLSTISGITVQNGDASLSVGFQGGGGIFNNSGADLTLTDVVVSGNQAAGGGGIFNFGSLSLTSSTVTGNSVNSADDAGGGINNQGTATIDSSSVTLNVAPETGGIANNGQLTIDGTTISGNSATGPGAGGISSEGFVTITNSTISDNTGDHGAGIDNQGDLSIDGSTITGNVAADSGGGIQNGGNLDMNDVTVTDNTATASGGGGLASFGGSVAIGGTSTFSGNTAGESGGAIAVDGDLLMTGGTLDGNSAATAGCCGGGGLSVGGFGNVTLQQVTISNNSSLGNDAGGGIFIFGKLTLMDSTVTGNTVPGDGQGGGIHVDSGGDLVMTGGEVSSNSAQRGGGISAEGLCSDCQPGPGTATLDGVTIDGNMATGDSGGGLLLTGEAQAIVTNSTVSGNTAPADGGGISNRGGTLTIDQTTVSGNSSDGPGGGIGNAGGALTITGSTIEDNSGAADGGGILNVDGGSVKVTDTTVSSNVAGCAGGGINNGDGDGVPQFDTLTVSGSTITGNSATGCEGGGGIMNHGPASITDTVVSGNTAVAGGGGIYNFGGSLAIVESTISGNTASGGGGLFNDNDGTGSVVRATISGNTSSGGGPESGGGLENWGTLSLTNSTVSGNSAAGLAGGLINQDSGTTAIRSSTITGNSATTAGALYNVAGGVLSIKNTIAANSSGGDDCFGEITSGGYDLVETPGGGCVIVGTATGNIIGMDPKLGPLADYGGPTFTHDLIGGSPARNAASPACPPPDTDQRGVVRPQGPRCDIGSFEEVGILGVTVDGTGTILPSGKVQVSGTIGCGAPDRWTLSLQLKQKSTMTIGTIVTKGNCTDAFEPWTAQVPPKAGTPGYAAGAATLCYAAKTRDPFGNPTDHSNDCVPVTLTGP